MLMATGDFSNKTRNSAKLLEASWNVTAHKQKPDFVFRRNGRVHLNRRRRQFSRLLAAEVLRISGSNVGYTMFRGSVKGTGYPLHSPISPSLHLPWVTVCPYTATGVYQWYLLGWGGKGGRCVELTTLPPPFADCLEIVGVWSPKGLFKPAKWLVYTALNGRIIEMSFLYDRKGDRSSTVVKVLCYKSEGRWFDPSWCHWNFSLT